MFTSLAFVPKGALKPTPGQTTVTDEERRRIEQELKQEAEAMQSAERDNEQEMEHEDGEENNSGDGNGSEEDGGEQDAISKALNTAAQIESSSARILTGGTGEVRMTGEEVDEPRDVDDMMAELDLEAYDSDSGEDALVSRIMKYEMENTVGHDPYLQDGSDSEEEKEDWEYKPDDIILVGTKTEEDVNTLEVWVYEEADDETAGNLFVHHDIVLSAFPLCLTFMDVHPGQGEGKCCMVAVGSMETGIDVWDLNVADGVDPVVTLVEKGSKAKKSKPDINGKHATLGLSWNSQFRNVLASGGGDKRVRVWDLATQDCKHKLKHHTKKVQDVAWNPQEAPVLVSAAFDKTACMVDVRTPEGDPLRWSLPSDAEEVAWCPYNPTAFVAACEDGMVLCFDARKGSGSEPLYKLGAHNKPTTVVDFSPLVPTLLMTASVDKEVKMWDVTGDQPTAVMSQKLTAGCIFTGGFCGADAPHLVAVGGDKGEMVVWDTRASSVLAKKYAQAVKVPKVFEEES